ncbi:unnamed protein product [Blepharisma stoltei]|uniref:Uncharacterized protein n=1 Tax=Blepharisma stoltei TaxID=1481888 RepID=A0AAU9ID33_9CILI|nr:unnamed protein product [Blepharisma stoltei]
MMIYILSLFWLVRGIYLEENIGDLYLAEGETYELKLSDYFFGNNLTYQISETDGKEDEISIKGDINFKLLSFLPFKFQASNDSFNLADQSYKSWNLKTSLVFCSFYQNYIYIYQIPHGERNITLIYAAKIQTQFLSPTIENVQNIKSENELIFLIYIRQQENIDKSLKWRNDFYILKATNALEIEEPILLELSPLTYASKIVMSNGESSLEISLYAEFLNENIPNTIYFYDFTYPYHPINCFNITKHFGFSSPDQQLSVKGILHKMIQIYVLDENIGLLTYANIFPRKLRENYFVDLRSYGDLISMWFLSGKYMPVELINIRTSLGSILIHMGGDVKRWIPNRENNEIKYETLFSQLYDDYFMASYVHKNESILSIIDINSPLETLIDINIDNLIGNTYNPRGMWMIINNFPDDEIFYVRSDIDGLRQFSLNFEPFKLKITGNSNFKAVITAKENDSSISNSLNIFSIPLGSKNIIPISNYRPAIVEPISLIFDAHCKEIMFPLRSYFSGPNLSYTIEPSNSALFSYNISIPNKVELYKRVTVPKETLWVEYKDASIIHYYKDYIEITREEIWNITKPINIVSTEKYAWIYWKTQESIPMISSYMLKDYSAIETWESETECSIFKHDINFMFFVCSDRKRIDIYLALDYSSKKWITLAGENFKEGFQWNLNEIFIYPKSFQKSLIYG